MKTALITGASGGIGYKIAMKFLSEGYFVAALYNNGEKNIEKLYTEADNKGFGGFLARYKCDLKDEKATLKVLTELIASFGHIDVLINNAGVDLYKLITETSSAEWDEVFNINVKSVYTVTNAILPSMISRKKGKILNISSIWGQKGAAMEVCYSASKAAVIGYTKALAKELAPCNINVNCICPGIIDTDMNKRFSEEEIGAAISEVPLNRIGNPEEVAESAYFLCSDKADYITGEVLTVDGGFSL